MARYAKIYRMFVASPSDTKEQRAKVFSAAYKWNADNSLDQEIFIEPVGWEYVISENSNYGGQHTIDQQMLDTSDFLIAIFDSMVGSSMEGNVSGTIHEIKRFSEELQKPAAVLFCKDDISRENLNIDHLQELKNFKEYCSNHRIYNEFTTNGLELKIFNVITHHVKSLKKEFQIKMDAYKGLRESPPSDVKPRKFKFSKEVLSEEAKLGIAFYKPEFDSNIDPENEWIKVKERYIDGTVEIDRNDIFSEFNGDWNYSFKFFLEVPRNRKTHFQEKLLEQGRVLTGDGEDMGDKWRIWFLYEEGFINPHYTSLSFLNQSLYRLPISI